MVEVGGGRRESNTHRRCRRSHSHTKYCHLVTACNGRAPFCVRRSCLTRDPTQSTDASGIEWLQKKGGKMSGGVAGQRVSVKFLVE